MISKSHPYWHVRSIVERRDDIATLSMSYYSYRPQTVADQRLIWQISADEFLDSTQVATIIDETPIDQELAIHSNVVTKNGALQHLVMVDMSTSAKAHLDKLRVYLGDNFFQQIAWFNSGRSFHGYGEELLSEQDWVQFMGLLLLANQPRIEPTVDPRWIGHRLLAGYAALRWTKKTSFYLTPPSKVESKTPNGRSSGEVGALGKLLKKPHNSSN